MQMLHSKMPIMLYFSVLSHVVLVWIAQTYYSKIKTYFLHKVKLYSELVNHRSRFL